MPRTVQIPTQAPRQNVWSKALWLPLGVGVTLGIDLYIHDIYVVWCDISIRSDLCMVMTNSIENFSAVFLIMYMRLKYGKTM